MLFGRFRILGKLTLLVLVPLIGVVALALPIVANRIDVARQAQDTSDAVLLANQVGSAVQELSEERLLSVGYLFGLISQPELVVQSAEATDRILSLKTLDQRLTPELTAAVDGVRRPGDAVPAAGAAGGGVTDGCAGAPASVERASG